MIKTYSLRQNRQRKIVLKKSGNYTVKLIGEGAKASITGTFWLKSRDKLNLNVTIIHSVPNTTANAIFKAVVDGAAKANITGNIIVEKDAQLTDSFLSEKILLLSSKATAHAIPNLEIEANDVKCSHAATVSSINEDQLFYLESRGISKTKAKTIIAEGFLQS